MTEDAEHPARVETKEIVDALLKLAKKQRVHNYELATAMGRHRNSVTHLRHHSFDPRLETVLRVAHRLGYTLYLARNRPENDLGQ